MRYMHLFFVVMLFASSIGGGAGVRAQDANDVLNFFQNELSLEAVNNAQPSEANPPQNQNNAQPAGSISDLFGQAPGQTQQNFGTPPGQGAPVTSATMNFDPKKVEKQIKNEAFNKALDSMLPLKPEQIRRLLEEFDRTQESYVLPVYPMPKPELTVQTLSLDPGTKPLTIRTAQGHVTTLNMLDVTGAPWPIEDITWAGNFNVIQSGDTESGVHFVRITPQSEFAYGNMSIKMIGLKTPIIMTIETSRDLVHYRFDAIVPDYGPMAEAPLIEGGVSLAAGASDMSSVLQGIIPSSAKPMAVTGADARTSAYKVGDRIFVRTPLTMLSPSWSNSVASADGMRVYTINETPVLLLSDKGKMVRVNLSQQEEIVN